MSKAKLTLAELTEPYRYQPPEVRDNAIIFVKIDGKFVQVVDSERTIVTINGNEYDALILTPME